MEGSAKELPAVKAMGREGGQSSRLAAKKQKAVHEKSEEEQVPTEEEVKALLSRLESETWGSGGVPQEQNWMVKVETSILEEMKIELDDPPEVQGSLEEADSAYSSEILTVQDTLLTTANDRIQLLVQKGTELETRMAALKVQKENEMGRLMAEVDEMRRELAGLLAGQEDSLIDMTGQVDTVGELEERQVGLQQQLDCTEQNVERCGDKVKKAKQKQLQQVSLRVRSLVICVVNMFPAGTEGAGGDWGGSEERCNPEQDWRGIGEQHRRS
jgi:hypothetical protein